MILPTLVQVLTRSLSGLGYAFQVGEDRKWITRDAAGQIEGPFTTEKVLYKIGRGELTGEEAIAIYPDGKWFAITRDPQFYDKLLEVLSQNERRDVDGTGDHTARFEFTKPAPQIPPRAAVSGDDTVRADRDRDDEDDDDGAADLADDTVANVGPTPPTVSRAIPVKGSRGRRRRPRDIELVDVRPAVVKQAIRRARLPIFVGVAGLALGSLMLVGGPKADEQRIHLLAPGKVTGPPATPDQLTARVRKAVTAFLHDTLDGYLQAENDFVYIAERNLHNAEVMGLLCTTYLRLWPYAYQDSRDAKVITGLVQMVNAVDPGGVHAATCRVVDLITRARYQEAKGLVENIIESKANEKQPPIVFYYLKGELLFMQGDNSSAVGYLHSAQQLWPQWVLPFVIEAQALAKMDKAADSARLYVSVLKNNPAHTVARIELGLLEYKQFNHADNGEKYLRQALEKTDAPRELLSRGFFGLAEIALQRGNQKRALEFAKKSYTINSSNLTAKNLIVQLGGIEQLRTTPIKGQALVFQGDQYFREGDYQAAQAHYKAAFEEDPKNGMAAVKAGQSLWKLSLSTEAMDWLNRAIKADPQIVEAYVTLADYLAQRYNFAGANRILQQGQSLHPKSAEINRGFALVELRRGNPKGAVVYGKRALELYANDVDTQIILAQASLDAKDYKMAFNYATSAVTVDANDRQAQIVYARALAALQGVDIGVDYLLRLVNNFPLVGEYRLAVGRMFMADERYQQAEEVFRQITHIEEKPKAAYVELARVLRAQGQAGEALDLLLKAAVLDPADAEPLYIAGLIFLDLHKPAEAAVQLQRVLMINKNFPMVNYQLGRAALQNNDAKSALVFIELEQRANPNLADAYLLAAEARTIMKQYSLCAQEYGRAIKLRPQPALTYVQLAQCNRQAGQLDAAMAMLNVAASKENGLADIYKEQGAIYELRGDVNHAIEAYNQYFVLNPDAADRKQIEGRISALQRGQTP